LLSQAFPSDGNHNHGGRRENDFMLVSSTYSWLKEEGVMPTLDETLRRRLIAKYGTSVDLQSQSGVVSEVLRDVADQIQADALDLAVLQKYDKTYTEGYNREGYSRANYTRYDRTDGDMYIKIFEEVIADVRPELDKLVIEKLRAKTPDSHK
jgi:hypothetical protein